MACGKRCRGATTKRCRCSCGGANHASGPIVEFPRSDGTQMVLPLWEEEPAGPFSTEGSEDANPQLF